MNMNFYMQTNLVTGAGCVAASSQKLAALGGRCLIVTGVSSAKKCGALADVETALEKENISYTVYDKIGQNPAVLSCLEAGELAHNIGAEFIVGIGGGSPLDAAKAVAVFAVNPGLTFQELFALDWKNRPLPVVAVGTTAGTGSEVTPVSVLTTPEGLKKSIRDGRIYPVLSLGDPRYTETLPDEFTRSTAVDAMAHCLESYFNKTANNISRTFALKGVSLLLDVFQKIVCNGTVALTPDDRETLYNASIYGGLAISVTGTAFPHAVGYFLSELHAVPHGTACAVFLTRFIRHSAVSEPALMKDFLSRLGVTEDALIALIEAVTPDCPVIVTKEEQERLAPRWVNNASIKKSVGEFPPEAVDEMINALFGNC